MDFSKLYHEQPVMEGPRGQRRAEGAESGKLLMSGVPPQSASWISNVEELVERREG
jgi:hypothetical protein